MKNALNDLLALFLVALRGIGARGAWRGMPLHGMPWRGDATRPLNRTARRAMIRQAKRLNRQGLGRVA